MMRWKPKTTPPADASQGYERFPEKLGQLGDFSFLDELPDDEGSKQKIPFPYGSPNAKPYGWFSN